MPSYDDLFNYLASFGVDATGATYGDMVNWIYANGGSIPGYDPSNPNAQPTAAPSSIPPTPAPPPTPPSPPAPPLYYVSPAQPGDTFSDSAGATGSAIAPALVPTVTGQPSTPQVQTMTINGYSNSDLTAAQHTDPSDPWFHFYWPLQGETPYVSWWPYDDRNNPSIYLEANQPGYVQRHPLAGTQITVGGTVLLGAGANTNSPTAGTVAAVNAGLVPTAVVQGSPALTPPPVTTSQPVTTTNQPTATSGTPALSPAIAPLLPVPPPANVNVVYLIMLVSDPMLQTPPLALAPGVITVTINGRNRQASTIADILSVLDQGGNVVRADGSGSLLQHVQAAGVDVDLGEGSPYLIDGNPLNVVVGQGWFPGQQDFINNLVAAGLTIPPTLGTAPTSSGAASVASGGDNSTLLLMAAGAAFLLFRK